MKNSYKWHPRPPNLNERVAAGIYLIILLLAIGSSFAGWQLFGNYDNRVVTALVILGIILMRLLPTARRTGKE
jgi:hypothetical protein